MRSPAAIFLHPACAKASDGQARRRPLEPPYSEGATRLVDSSLSFEKLGGLAWEIVVAGAMRQ